MKFYLFVSLLRLRKAKKEAPPMEKPACIKTHMRNMLILPEMIGSVVGIHNGKTFNQVEIKVSSYTPAQYIKYYIRALLLCNYDTS